jgi:bile acid:Na+ symporter, BASS family
MSVDRLINILVTITLVQMMISIGLGVTLADIGAVARNWGVLSRAAVANYICVPAVVIGLLLWFRTPPLIAVGFLIVAVCPGAPYGPPFTALARGNPRAAVGLMVVLAGSSVIAAPLLLQFLVPLVAGGPALRFDARGMVRALLASQLLPLCAGLLILHWLPRLAESLKQPFSKLSVVLNLSVFGLILGVHCHTFGAIRLSAFAGIFALVISSLLIGWVLGEPGSSNRKTMGFSTSVRNVAVSLVIATGSFPGTPAVTAALVYGLFQTLVLALVALVWGRLETMREPIAGAFTVSPSGSDQMSEKTRP